MTTSATIGRNDTLLMLRLACHAIVAAMLMSLVTQAVVAGAAGLYPAVLLVLAGHTAFTMLWGGFGKLRVATWLVLTGLWLLDGVLGVLGYMLPFGQMQFWLANQLAAWPSLGEPLLRFFLEDLPAGSFAFLLVAAMAADLAAALARTLAGRDWRWGALTVAGAVALFALDLVAGLDLGHRPEPVTQPDAFAIVPPWYALPWYAVMRAVPGKEAGLAAAMLLAASFLLVPSMRADRIRGGWPIAAWALVWLAWLMAWIGMTVLGAQSAEEAGWSPLWLAAWHFLVLLALPHLLSSRSLAPAGS